MARQQSAESFYGSTIRTRHVADFTLTERVYPPCFITPNHAHSRSLFCIVLEGGYQETHQGRTWRCTPSTLLFHPAYEAHVEQFEETGGRSLVVEIEPMWLERVRDISNLSMDASAVFDRGTLSVLGMKLYKEFLSADEPSRLVIEGLLLEIAGEVFRAGNDHDLKPPRWLDDARELIRTQFARHLTLASIGESVGVHPVHLAQAFRKFYQCTVGDYVRKLRIEFACRELISSDVPLVQLALLAGFADQSHFTRTFKQVVGTSPSQYREEARRRRVAASA